MELLFLKHYIEEFVHIYDRHFRHYLRGDTVSVLTLKEELILSALMIQGGSSRGAPIRNTVIEFTGKEIVYGTLYNLLENLIRKGYVTSRKGEPTPVQGGRSKTIYTITEEGKSALQETIAMHEKIKNRLPDVEFGI